MNPILILDAYGLSSNQFQLHMISSISSYEGYFFATYHYFYVNCSSIYACICILNTYTAYLTYYISKSFQYTPFQGTPWSKICFWTLQNFFRMHIHIIHKSLLFFPVLTLTAYWSLNEYQLLLPLLQLIITSFLEMLW